MLRILIVVLAAAFLSACQTPPDIAQMNQKNAALEEELRDARQEIDALQQRESELQGQVEELQRITGVLAVEKTSRVQESSQLRQQVRRFMQQQIDDLKTFLVAGDLLDYVGSELVKRGHLDDGSVSLVDLRHPMPRSGSLTGVTGFFSAPTELELRVLRPVDEKYLVIWESGTLSATEAGEVTLRLPVSVGVEPDDVIAYVFPTAANVSFDRGTGDTRYTSRELSLGETVKPSSLSGESEKRSYSLGVYAILE